MNKHLNTSPKLWEGMVIRHWEKDKNSVTGLSPLWEEQARELGVTLGLHDMKGYSSNQRRTKSTLLSAIGRDINDKELEKVHEIWALWYDLWPESSEFYQKNMQADDQWKYFEFLVCESDNYLKDNENYSTYSKVAWDYAEELLRYITIRDRLLTRKLDPSKRWMDLTEKNGLDSSITYIDNDWNILLLEEFEDEKEDWQKKYELVRYEYKDDNNDTEENRRSTDRVVIKTFENEDSKSFVDYCKNNWIRAKIKKWLKPWEEPSAEKVNDIKRLFVSHSWVLELLLLKVIEKQEWWKEWVLRFINDNNLQKGVWFLEWYNISMYGDTVQLEFRGVKYDLSNKFLKDLVDERDRLQKIAREEKSKKQE